MECLTQTVKVKQGNVYDIIVVGGGPSGCAAAILAGRNGAKVLLIEQQNCLGGMWTSGFVNPLFDHANKKGLLKEIIDDLKTKNAWGGFWNESFIYEYMKLILEQKCAEAKVDVLLGTTYSGVKTDGRRVLGVYVENIEGRTYYPAEIIIDGSGDAAVAADSGAEWTIGDPDDGSCQAMTLMFLVSGFPEKYRDGLMVYDTLERAFEKEGKGHHLVFNKPWMIPAPNSNLAVFQLTHLYNYNPLSAMDRSRAFREGREQMIQVFEALKYYDDEFKDLTLVSSAPLLGIRESRRIVGEYTLTVDDLLSGAQFSDGMFTCSFNIDVHQAHSIVQKCTKVSPYQVPYRCCIPQKLDNLYVVGKTISGSHVAMASYRVTGDCCAMGDAVGRAAAYAISHHISIREVPDEVVCEKK